MADTYGTRLAHAKMAGLAVEVWTGTMGGATATTDECICATAMHKVIGKFVSWAEDIGGTAVTLEALTDATNPGTVNVMSNANMAKSFTLLVVGYP